MTSNRYPPIILASASPRRRELLAEAGFEFKVIPPRINESNFRAEYTNPYEYAKQVALAKANKVAKRYPEHLVIGADTVVDFGGEIVGKPDNAKDAEKITRKLFSAHHKVITAVAIVRLSDNIELVESDTTTVYPKRLTDGQIAKHIKSESWKDKAGAYAIQETGDEFVERIEGSLTNVMGLPMELFQKILRSVPPV
jgi:septum formation protein